MQRSPHDEPPPRPPRNRGGGELAAWAAALVLLAAVAVGVGLPSVGHSRAQQADLQAAMAEAQATLEEAVAREAAAARGAPPSPAAGEARERVVDDPAGRLLWASPTAGPPISLAYMPAGAQCFVFVRPRELADHPEGKKALAALGPWGEWAARQLQTFAGLAWRDVETLLVAATTNAAGDVEFCVRLELARMYAKKDMNGLIFGGERRKHADQDYYVDQEVAKFAAWSDGGGGGSWLVFCPERLVPELMDSRGEPPMIARDLESLARHADVERTATLLASTGFLAAGATRVVSPGGDSIPAALAELAGRDATALAVSVDWGDRFFVELAAAPALTASPRWLAATLAERVRDAAQRAAAPPEGGWLEHGRAVLDRYPAMIARLAAMTRSGEIDKLAVLRAYLPVVAGHNLLMATELRLMEATAGAASR